MAFKVGYAWANLFIRPWVDFTLIQLQNWFRAKAAGKPGISKWIPQGVWRKSLTHAQAYTFEPVHIRQVNDSLSSSSSCSIVQLQWSSTTAQKRYVQHSIHTRSHFYARYASLLISLLDTYTTQIFRVATQPVAWLWAANHTSVGLNMSASNTAEMIWCFAKYKIFDTLPYPPL